VQETENRSDRSRTRAFILENIGYSGFGFDHNVHNPDRHHDNFG